MALEEHVKAEIGRQLDYYVDAYRKVHDLDLRMASLAEQMEAVRDERVEAVRLMDAAQESIDSLTEDIPEDDEDEVRSLTEEHLKPLIGIMVM